jgi:GDP-4-dehydro-6-deoxy-D-mannose reductase
MMLPPNSKPITSLITGVNGFVGKYLAAHLAMQNRTIIGIDTQEDSPVSFIQYTTVDIRDVQSLSRLLKASQPQEIYHLAGISFPPQFNVDQYSCFQINLLGTIALLEAIHKNNIRAKVLMIGSSKQYKPPEERILISEETPLDPDSFYGISKYFSELFARRYGLLHSIDIRYTRSFNHTGPGQSPQFVCSDWARQIALINSKKMQPSISVGNIDKVIDFSDVRDVVEAYRLIVEHGKMSEAYNVGSGKGISLKYILEYLISKSTFPISVKKKQEKSTSIGAPEKYPIGDNRKILEDVGWSPKILIEKTLDDLYNWWLSEVNKP